MLDVGSFSPDMATENIDMTWKLETRFYNVRYEPGAMVWMRVPTTFRTLVRQRRRWALGLSQVLRRHGPSVFSSWRRRRMWPVAAEAVLSIAWAYLFRRPVRDHHVISTPKALFSDRTRSLALWHTPRIGPRPSSSVPKAA